MSRAVPNALAALFAAVAMLVAAASAHAEIPAPAVHVGFGRDYSHDINKYEIGFQFDSGFRWGNPQGWQTTLYWEFDIAQWQTRYGTPRQNVVEGGVSPLFRLQKRGGAWEPFIEGSVGFRIMSHSSTSPQHNYSTAFRFTEIVGVGVAFGPRNAAEFGLRFQHLSNGTIKKPNPGTDFITGYFNYRF
ncbi:acyloxyacyl hydrolase [Cupriavidus plantarum]|uniref:acyloxyacyl hydrolase n=1 Tax=Cupriavidus plantarum TaxID=942865 RepID=UPI000E281273|nr:acyloxyacyl hydrolase [Cupriavidus plantarum]REE93288.1 lipid A 3-O-deacylase PagL [Cupriavidus plantarum]